MIGIHPVHRRLAELTIKARRLGNYARLSLGEQQEIFHCLQVNADLVQQLDGLKELAFQAHVAGEHEWEQDICQRIDELEATIL